MALVHTAAVPVAVVLSLAAVAGTVGVVVVAGDLFAVVLFGFGLEHRLLDAVDVVTVPGRRLRAHVVGSVLATRALVNGRLLVRRW